MSEFKVRDDARLVVKYGGSSLADGARVSNAANMILEALKRGKRVAVVVSAMGRTTDDLMRIASEALNGVNPGVSELDDLLSMGERTSARLLTTVLRSMGVEARYFDPEDEDWPIITDERFGDAEPILPECGLRIRDHVAPLLDRGAVPVIPGFIGKTLDGRITTIGRGGSDTTAFILARYLGAGEVILVTDVDGIMTADPKIVGEAKPLPEISARELAGLADSGTKFIHKKALRYKPRDVNVRVLNYRRGTLEAGGTLIRGEFPGELEAKLGFHEPIDMVTVVGRGLSSNPQLVYRLLRAASSSGRILGVSSDENSLILYLSSPDGKALKRIHRIVSRAGGAVAMAARRSIALIRVEGVGLEDTPGIIGRISNPLRDRGVNIFGMFTVASSISTLVDWEKRDEAVQLIKESLDHEQDQHP
ncbi:MAG: aspartate kinase [Candidatus Bathyarchaeia archaeon]|nr:aspartate kinase [Candidatus Bathyarchaeota archaeon]